MAQLVSYSLMNVNATLSGPGAQISLGYGAAVAKEGITAEMLEEKDGLLVGADGSIMHSLRGGNAGRISVRLLKTAPANAALSIAYNFQRTNASFWGQNILMISDVQRGDVVTATNLAFTKFPTVTWAEDGNTLDWVFTGNVLELLGLGTADINL